MIDSILIVIGIALALAGNLWLRVLLMSDKSDYSIGAKILGAELIYAFHNLKKCRIPLLLMLCGLVCIFIWARK